ncbi:MAG: hypothetical protein OJF51_001278 [Nitrospira sp.]|jgi:phage shock protein A|nr:MAG: hypothetical protein OJF51_001278 [Nitrospira sp.]
MATLNEILAEQAKLIGGAKAALEAAQKKPPTNQVTITARESTIAELKARIENLTNAKSNIVAQLDQQITAYKVEIAEWEKQIEEDKKSLGEQSAPPRQPKRKGEK